MSVGVRKISRELGAALCIVSYQGQSFLFLREFDEIVREVFGSPDGLPARHVPDGPVVDWCKSELGGFAEGTGALVRAGPLGVPNLEMTGIRW